MGEGGLLGGVYVEFGVDGEACEGLFTVEEREEGFASVDVARGVEDNVEDMAMGEVPAAGREERRGLEETSRDGLAGDDCKKGFDLPEFEDIPAKKLAILGSTR